MATNGGYVYSCHSQHGGMDRVIDMAIYVIFYNFLFGCLRMARFVIHWIGLLQRLPLLILGALIVVGGRLGHALFGWHRWYLVGVKWLLRISFFFRGINIKVPKTWPSGVHVLNNDGPVPWLLLAVVPTKDLIVAADSFFEPKFARSFLFLLGFVPQEYGITPTNLSSFESRLGPYLAQDFRVWQPVFFEYRDTDPVPYAVMLGLQGQVPVHVWQLTNVREFDTVHWLKRRTIALTHVAEVPYSKRMAIMLASYHHVVQQTFGLPEKADLQRRQTLPGMPEMPADLVQKRVAETKAVADSFDLSSDGSID